VGRRRRIPVKKTTLVKRRMLGKRINANHAGKKTALAKN
jgi:hypothetical protein